MYRIVLFSITFFVLRAAWAFALAGGSGSACTKTFDLPEGRVLACCPAGLDHAGAVIVALHGTNTDAQDIIRFWRSLIEHDETLRGVTVIAPQGVGRGWCDRDLPLLHAVAGSVLAKLPHDSSRVLLTGHSAGGAMAFRLAYVDRFPCSYLATTANYMPPSVTKAHIEAFQNKPVFYAVGLADYNRPRMLSGIRKLQQAGVPLTVYRPDIKHELNAELGGRVLAWFCEACHDLARQKIDRAREALHACGETIAGDSRAASPSASACGTELAAVERILQYRRDYPPALMADATALLREANALVQCSLTRVEVVESKASPTTDGDAAVAQYESLLVLERRFRPAAIAGLITAKREVAQALPVVKAMLARRKQARAAVAAKALMADVEHASRRQAWDEAARLCKELIDRYPDSPEADKARTMRGILKRMGHGS